MYVSFDKARKSVFIVIVVQPIECITVSQVDDGEH